MRGVSRQAQAGCLVLPVTSYTDGEFGRRWLAGGSWRQRAVKQPERAPVPLGSSAQVQESEAEFLHKTRVPGRKPAKSMSEKDPLPQRRQL